MNPWAWSGLPSMSAGVDAITAATVAVAAVAIVQIGREIWRDIQNKLSVRRRLWAAAWLARRSCEVTLRAAPGRPNDHAVALRFTAAPGLDRLQHLFREVLELSTGFVPVVSKPGQTAFENFLAAADRFNEIIDPTTPAMAEIAMFPVLCEQGLEFLYDGVVALECLAPRQSHEPALPARATLRRLPTQEPTPQPKDEGYPP